MNKPCDAGENGLPFRASWTDSSAVDATELLLDSGLLSRDNQVSDETRHLLANEKFTEIVSFPEDTIIIQQRSKPEALYFTLEGIFHAISHANPGAPYRLLGRIKPGQFIGEACLVDERTTASATVKALRNSMALKMKPEAFKSLCEAHPAEAVEFLRAVSRQLAARLRDANEKVL